MGEIAHPHRPRRRLTTYQIAQIVVGVLFLAFLTWRLYDVLVVQAIYGPEVWLRFAIAGIVLGSVYAVIAIGYTLVYGILRMINFAHGDVMMIGAFAGYFVLEVLNAWVIDPAAELSALNAYPVPAIVLSFLAGMIVAMVVGIVLERVAYRPLRAAPRLVPLISAIGASFFLEEAVRLIFGAQRRVYTNPEILNRTLGFEIAVNGQPVLLTYTGIFTLVLSTLLMLGLFALVQRTRLGRSMRAVAEDKRTAALMGIDVDAVIGRTFLISGILAGAAGVMWGLHNGQIYHFVGFFPGLKAFTAAVLGGIGNIPGAMLGGLFLGISETMGPAALGMDFQLKDVIGFSILVLILVFRPSGILGEVLTEEKV